MSDHAPHTIAAVRPHADGGLSPEQVREMNDERMRADQEHRDRMSRIAAAWDSPEAKAVHEFVRQDGNVDWREFVGFCGGILEVVAMVGEDGRPDPEKVVPRIDELFYRDYSQKESGAFKVTRHPRNRPARG